MLFWFPLISYSWVSFTLVCDNCGSKLLPGGSWWLLCPIICTPAKRISVKDWQQWVPSLLCWFPVPSCGDSCSIFQQVRICTGILFLSLSDFCFSFCVDIFSLLSYDVMAIAKNCSNYEVLRIAQQLMSVHDATNMKYVRAHLRLCIVLFRNSANWRGLWLVIRCFDQIAVYGKSFNQSARDAWELFQSTGVEALVAYDCSGAVLLMGSVLGGLISGTCAGVWAWIKASDRVVMIGSTSMLMGMVLVIFLCLSLLSLNGADGEKGFFARSENKRYAWESSESPRRLPSHVEPYHH